MKNKSIFKNNFLTFFFLAELVKVYDMMMLPPDAEASKSWFQTFTSFFTSIITNYYNRSMLKTYQESAFQTMFYELFDAEIKMDKKWNSFDFLLDYLECVIENIENFYARIKYNTVNLIGV